MNYPVAITKVRTANVVFSLERFLTMGGISRQSSLSKKKVALFVNIGERDKRKRIYTSFFIKNLQTAFFKSS